MTLTTDTGTQDLAVPENPPRAAVNDFEENLPKLARPTEKPPTEMASTRERRAVAQSIVDAVDCPNGCHYCEGPETD